MSAKPTDPQALQDAFSQFNRLYEDLEASYRNLEQQVSNLSDELAFAQRKGDSEAQSRQQLRSKYAGLLNLLPAGVIVLNSKGEIIEANAFANDLLGMPLLGRRWQQVIRDSFAPQTDDGHEISLLNGKRVKLETRALDYEPGQIILITDQTATRNLQKQLSQNERLSALGKMSSALAHQIRTPLAAALLHAGNLRDMPLTREQTQRIAAKLSENLQQLEGQVRDMLVFSRANIPLQDRVAPSELVAAVSESIAPEYAAAQVALEYRYFFDEQVLSAEQWHSAVERYTIPCNRATLVGAIDNLLDNALQASELGATVSCVFRLHGEPAALRLDVQVVDQGCGISADMLARIHQGENFATSKAQGTGLGLTVVRAVSAAHGAHFAIDSVAAEGTAAAITDLRLHLQADLDANAAPTADNFAAAVLGSIAEANDGSVI